MKTIAEAYRFWIDLPGVGVVQVFPQNAELRWIWQKKKGYRFYQKTLETKLSFIDAPSLGLYDFTKLANLERMGMTCERVPITMDSYCECDNTWSIGVYRGYLKLSAADKWDYDICQVGLPVVVDDVYGCLTTNWTKEFNMFDFGDPAEEISPFIGVVQFMECESAYYTKTWTHPNIPTIGQVKAYVRQHWIEHYQTQCLTDYTTPIAWTLIQHTYAADFWLHPSSGLFDPTKFNAKWKIKTKYAREFYAGVVMPPGPLWSPCTGGFHRPVSISNNGTFDWDNSEDQATITEAWAGFGDIDDGELWRFVVVGLDGNGAPILNNGKSMGPVVQGWLDRCGLTLVSNFYNINPDGTQPLNDYYARAAEDIEEMFLFQVTDVARLDETASATKALMKFKELVDTLYIPHNTEIELDPDGVTLRWEHASYFDLNVGMDLTLPEFLHFIEGKNAYGYDTETQPNIERFGWAIETDKEGGDFDGYPIEYRNACVDDRDEKTEEIYRSNTFLTNVQFVTGNEDFYDSKEILIVATVGGVVELKLMPVTPGDSAFLGPVYRLNGAMALKYCLPRYHDYARPFKEGLINLTLVDMYSTQRQKRQVDIQLEMSCLDYRDNFKPNALIKTQLGAGAIDKAQWIEPQEELTVTLKQK